MAVRVAFTRCLKPYASDVGPIDAVRGTRVLEVVTVAIDGDRQHPVLGNHLGGGDDRTRAVQDLVGHVHHGHGFHRYGEFAAWLAQDSLYSGIARRALASELHAEHSVICTTGIMAPDNATLTATDVSRRARRALARPTP